MRADLIRPLPEIVLAQAERLGAKVAYSDGERAITYADLAVRTARLAGHLADHGLAPGDRAAILLGNRVEMIESYVAIARASGIAVPLDPGSTDADLGHQLDDSGARFVITDSARANRVYALAASRARLTIVVVIDDDSRAPAGVLRFRQLTGTVPASPPRDDLGLDDPAWLLYTAGTTGTPKGVLSTQRNCLWSVASFVPIAGMTEDDRVVWPTPLSRGLSHIVCVLGVLAVGASARIVPGCSAGQVLRAVEDTSATIVGGTPTMYHRLVRAPEESGFRSARPRVCIAVGAATTAGLRREVEKSFATTLLDVYGSTETCGPVTINGLPVPNLAVRVVDPSTGQDVAAERAGEVWVRGQNVMAGYHDQPAVTAGAMRDGWYRTGDLATRDAAGRLTVTGRIKDMVILGGEYIHPGEVEDVVRSVPGVADVAVTSKPHPVLDVVPVAFLVAGADGLDPEQVLATCRKRLSYLKVPAELYQVDRLPRTTTGQAKRHALHAMPASLLAGAAGQYDSLFGLDWVPLAATPRTGAAEPPYRVRTVPVAVPGEETPERLRTVLTGVQEALADLREDTTLVVCTEGAVAVHSCVEVRDPVATAVWGLVRAAQAANPGRILLVDLDAATTDLGQLVDAAMTTDESQVAVRFGQFFVPRLRPTADDPGLVPPESPWRLEVTLKTGAIADLALVDNPAASKPLAAGQVRIAVRAAGVTFRDVLTILGKVPESGIGAEAAGVVLAVGAGVTSVRPGDRVFGLVGDFGAFGDIAVTDSRLLTRMPDGWSFDQAAAVPVAYLTALHGLRDLAAVGHGDTVLVHAAAGGVGMAAVQLARHFGAEVFGTASRAKWPVLRALGLTDDHIAGSRSTEFADRFRTVLGGRGIDVVLNSLTGECADASVELLADGGCFLELDRTAQRDPGTVPHGHYETVDVRDAGHDRIGELLAELVTLFATGALSLPRVSTWDIRRAPEAFRFLSQTRHVGKVVLTTPRKLDPAGTVLITGGTGGIGGLLARHLVATHGVRRLLLVSRSGIDADGADELVAWLIERGATVTVAVGDVADRVRLAELLAGIPAEHPLTAVVHAAGVLADGAQRLDAVLAPKADGATHLDELTRDLDLAAFVLCSSTAGVFGNPGQSNHAAANAYLDGVAHRRRATGTPAVSLAWGMWPDSGMRGPHDAEGLALFDAGLRSADAGLVAAALTRNGRCAAGEVVPVLLRGLMRAERAVASGHRPA